MTQLFDTLLRPFFLTTIFMERKKFGGVHYYYLTRVFNNRIRFNFSFSFFFSIFSHEEIFYIKKKRKIITIFLEFSTNNTYYNNFLYILIIQRTTVFTQSPKPTKDPKDWHDCHQLRTPPTNRLTVMLISTFPMMVTGYFAFEKIITRPQSRKTGNAVIQLWL